MDVKYNYSVNFGMAFPCNNIECKKYLTSFFPHNSQRLNKALADLNKRCDAHKYFDMFHSSHDDSIKIIGKSELAGKILSERHGNSILSIRKDVEYPNVVKKMEERLDILEKSPEGPKNIFEKLLFKAFRFFSVKYAQIKSKRNPYENLPANIRKGVDIIDELEKKMP